MKILEHVSKEERVAAQQAVLKAIRAGKLVRPKDCAWCGDDTKSIHAHHPDYARPLMVVWICGPCHTAHHVRYRHERDLFKEVEPKRAGP